MISRLEARSQAATVGGSELAGYYGRLAASLSARPPGCRLTGQAMKIEIAFAVLTAVSAVALIAAVVG